MNIPSDWQTLGHLPYSESFLRTEDLFSTSTPDKKWTIDVGRTNSNQYLCQVISFQNWDRPIVYLLKNTLHEVHDWVEFQVDQVRRTEMI